jgi:hypothetical protein
MLRPLLSILISFSLLLSSRVSSIAKEQEEEKKLKESKVRETIAEKLKSSGEKER